MDCVSSLWKPGNLLSNNYSEGEHLGSVPQPVVWAMLKLPCPAHNVVLCSGKLRYPHVVLSYGWLHLAGHSGLLFLIISPLLRGGEAFPSVTAPFLEISECGRKDGGAACGKQWWEVQVQMHESDGASRGGAGCLLVPQVPPQREVRWGWLVFLSMKMYFSRRIISFVLFCMKANCCVLSLFLDTSF